MERKGIQAGPLLAELTFGLFPHLVRLQESITWRLRSVVPPFDFRSMAVFAYHHRGHEEVVQRFPDLTVKFILNPAVGISRRWVIQPILWAERVVPTQRTLEGLLDIQLRCSWG
jgi:hypothetical protein